TSFRGVTQSSVAMSSAEAEYVAATASCAQVLWIKSQLADYNVLYDKVPIFCDNTSVIAILNNPVLHSKKKHIDIRALTLQPTAMYVEYLKEFWYIAEVEEETKTITFLLSWWDKPLSFTQDESISTIGLAISKLSEEPEQSLIPPSGEVNADDTTDKSLSKAYVQSVTQSKAPTYLKIKKKRIPPSFKPNADAIKSLVASELAEEQENQPSSAEAEKLLDEPDKLNKVVQEIPKSLYDTKSEIKVVKSFLTSNFSKLQKDFDFDLQSMPNDDLRSVSGFEAADSDDTHENEVSKSDHLGDMESFIFHQISMEIKSSLPSLVTTTLKEQLPGLLLDSLKYTLPQLIKDSIKSSVSESIAEELPQEKNNPETPKDTYVQGEQSVAKENTEIAMITHKSKEKKLEGPEEQQKSVQEFTDQLFATYSSKFSPTPLREPTPHRDSAKGKEVAIIEEQVNQLVSYQEEGGYIPKMPKIKSFITPEGTLSQEEYINQIKKLKRLSDLKAEKEKSEQELKKIFNQATLKAQTRKWTKHEAKKAKMMKEYNHQISFRADPLPITKISYVVDSNKEATMKITRGDNPLNLIVHPNFRLRTLLEVYALASKKTGKSNDMLLQSLRAKFQLVITQLKKLGLPPPPTLATFGMTVGDKKRKGQRENEFHLSPTKLIRIQNQIKVDSEIASEMFTQMIYVIEAKIDCIEAKKIVEKNLDNVG
nr:uncharacterized mitochondrial protein AtMg00810-like [Tanacetum cinerariifolium]